MDGGSGDVSIGPPTCNFQVSYGNKPVGVSQIGGSVTSHSIMFMFDSYFFYSSTDYPTGWAPGGVLDPPLYHTLMNLTIQGNASIIRNGTVVNAVTLLPQHYNGTTNQFNLTCYWASVPFYYDALHLILPYTTKCDVQMANLSYPAGLDSVGLRVVAMSSLEEQNLNQDDGNAPHPQSHTTLGAGTFDWDSTVMLNGNVSRLGSVFGNGPSLCGNFAWLTPAVKAYLLANVSLDIDHVLCQYYSFATAGQAKFIWDPVLGLDVNASAPDAAAAVPDDSSSDTIGLGLGLGLGLGVGIPLAIIVVVLLYLVSLGGNMTPEELDRAVADIDRREARNKYRRTHNGQDIELEDY